MVYGATFIFTLALTLYALVDVVLTNKSVCRIFPKGVWLPIVFFFPLVGPAGWLLLGRPERTSLAVPAADGQNRPASRPVRPLGPDDDPRFIELTKGHPVWGDRPKGPQSPKKAEQPQSPEQSRPEQGVADLKAWEADLLRREAELRRKLEGEPPQEP